MPDLVSEAALTDLVARAENLPTVPAVAVEVLRLTQEEEAPLDELAEVLRSDPVLSAKLLKLANSSLFNLGQEVTHLHSATMVLGTKTVKLMALSFSLAEGLPREVGDGPDFDLGGFWHRSLVAAVAGRSFARLVDSPDADEAFLCGLLSHLGQLVLARCLPDTYAPVLEAAGARWPSLPMERRLLGLCHSDVAATLLSEWGLPTAVVVPVSYMFRPNELGETAPELRRLTFLMAVTGLMVQVLCDASKSKALAKLHELCAKHFDLTEREVDSFLIGLESGIRETAELLSLPVAEGLGHQELVDEARQRMVSVSLGTAMDLREARRKAEDLTERNRELLDRATADKLTGVANRAAFDQVLDEAVRARLQPGSTRSLGLVLLDIDHFKRFNDTHGHQAGDAVLAAVGQHLKGVTRRGDLAARYGGEEFALLLPSTTPALLGAVAERVRAGLEDLRVTFGDEQLQVTASLGGACLTTARRAEDAQALVAAADELLYRAKHGGRNRCEVRREEELPGR